MLSKWKHREQRTSFYTMYTVHCHSSRHECIQKCFLDDEGEEIELSQIGDDLFEDNRGYVTDDREVSEEDVGPTVLEEGDEEHFSMVDEDEINESFANSEDEFEDEFGDDYEDDNYDEE